MQQITVASILFAVLQRNTNRVRNSLNDEGDLFFYIITMKMVCCPISQQKGASLNKAADTSLPLSKIHLI